jgi:methionine sulfoxide reductase catalytic subunit
MFFPTATISHWSLSMSQPESPLSTIPVSPSEITPERLYLSRRHFLKAAALTGAAALLAACTPQAASSPQPSLQPGVPASPVPTAALPPPGSTTDELGAPLNTLDQISNYNNYYEFTTDKTGVAELAADFPTSPWQLEVYGLVNKPITFSLEDLLRQFPPEERIYRLRCVEAWSMVIPWQGFQLSKLLEAVEPQPSAKFVRFEGLLDPQHMPGQLDTLYPWPYQEGLRLDEAMQRLTILATGLYGKPLPPQDGAPLRLVVPWKYGFKSIKALVKIELVTDQPKTMWSTIAPDEYGFYSNVNPNVPHPRWSQASERRIGSLSRIPTLMFNGYGEVAPLYQSMDLEANY